MSKPRNPNRVPALSPTSPLRAELGALFKGERKRGGVTLASLAFDLECAINTIRYHESGTRMLRIDEVIKAAGIFGCPVDALLPPVTAAAA